MILNNQNTLNNRPLKSPYRLISQTLIFNSLFLKSDAFLPTQFSHSASKIVLQHFNPMRVKQSHFWHAAPLGSIADDFAAGEGVSGERISGEKAAVALSEAPNQLLYYADEWQALASNPNYRHAHNHFSDGVALLNQTTINAFINQDIESIITFYPSFSSSKDLEDELATIKQCIELAELTACRFELPTTLLMLSPQ